MATVIINAITAVFSCLCGQNCLNEALVRQWNSFRDVEKNLKKLKKDIKTLNARSGDIKRQAAINQGKELKEVVNLWLESVKKIGEVVDDIKENEESCLTGCCCYLCSRLNFAEDIGKKIDTVTELLNSTPDFSQLFIKKVPNDGIKFPNPEFRYKTSALEKIKKHLKNSDIGIIGVVGMGGVGKSEIMKQINNMLKDDISKKNSAFNSVIWVNISMDSSLEKLQDDIASAIELSDFPKNNEDLRAYTLSEALKGKNKFVIILDNMWEGFSLEKIGIPKPNISNGCKVVLTTRLHSVCQKMETDKEVKVNLLSEKEAWILFQKKIAIDMSKNKQKDGLLAGISMNVAKECGGLPLALITAGQALRKCYNLSEWKNTLNDFKDSKTACIGDMEKVITCLKISYDRLSDDITRSCFLYCSLYPEDLIETNELIMHWISEELILDPGTNREKIRTGERILKQLIEAFLLESVGEDTHGVKRVKMHKLVRDMAIQITRISHPCIIKAGVKLQEPPPVDEWTKDVKWVSLMRNYLNHLQVSQPKCSMLTSLLLQYNSIIGNISDTFFEHMQNLKVLNLSHTDIDALPKSVSNLKKLQALILQSCGNLTDVPCLGGLSELMLLDLSHTPIKELPLKLENLKKLRSLNISYTQVRCFPTGLVSNFTSLEDLLTDGCHFLWGLDAEDSNQGKACVWELINCTNLTVLEVGFADVEAFDIYVSSGNSDRLDRFKFYIKYIQGFFICCGVKYFNQLVSSFLLPANTLELDLSDCSNVKSLSAFASDVSQLRKCWIRCCGEMEWIFMKGENPLTNLEEIELEDLGKLRGLCQGVAQPGTFEALKLLKIINCEKLGHVFSRGMLLHLQNLESITVENCSSMICLIIEDDEKVDDDHGDDRQEEIDVDDYSYHLDRMYGGGGDDDCREEVDVSDYCYYMNRRYHEDDCQGEIKEETDADDNNEDGHVEANGNDEDDGGSNAAITISRLRLLRLKRLPELRSIYGGAVFCDSRPIIEVEECSKMKKRPFFSLTGSGASLKWELDYK